MAVSGEQPIVIKKVKKVVGGGHHGGAWKVAYADFVTAMMALFMVLWISAQDKEIVIATEAGMLHRLQKECPDKTFIPAPTDKCACNECRFMKMNTLTKVRDCLRDGSPEILMDESVRLAAEIPLRRMLEWSK